MMLNEKLPENVQWLLWHWTMDKPQDRINSALNALMEINPHHIVGILQSIEQASFDNPFNPDTDTIEGLSGNELTFYMAMLIDSGLICTKIHEHTEYHPHIRSDMLGTAIVKKGYVFLTIKGYELLDILRGTSWRDKLLTKKYKTAQAE